MVAAHVQDFDRQEADRRLRVGVRLLECSIITCTVSASETFCTCTIVGTHAASIVVVAGLLQKRASIQHRLWCEYGTRNWHLDLVLLGSEGFDGLAKPNRLIVPIGQSSSAEASGDSDRSSVQAVKTRPILNLVLTSYSVLSATLSSKKLLPHSLNAHAMQIR